MFIKGHIRETMKEDLIYRQMIVRQKIGGTACKKQKEIKINCIDIQRKSLFKKFMTFVHFQFIIFRT